MKAFPEIFAIVDVETTGMRPPFSRVTDIGIIRVEKGKVVRRFESLVNPGMPIPSSITGFTGISDDMVQSAPAFEELALEVKEVLDGAVFVAHNAAFDYGFIKSEFGRTGITFTAETLCSVQLSRALFPKERGHSLDKVIERCGIVCESRHRAMPDVQAVFDFFHYLDRTVEAHVLEKAVAHIRGGYGASIGRGSFTDLPDSSGVYFFYGPEQELLYIGKSKNIRTRVQSHFQGGVSNKELRIRGDTSSIDAIRTSGELSALLLESSLIKRESPLFNRMLRRRKVLVVARKVMDKKGYARVSLERSSDITPDGTVLGIFRTMMQGKTVLRDLGKVHRVCEKMLGIEMAKGECFARQLGACDGACTGILDARGHNERIDAAFKSRRIRTWPHSGPIMIREAEDEERGTVFFIDNWALVGAFRYDNGAFEKFAEVSGAFEYDTYKILARYMRKRANRKYMQALTQKEFRALYAQCTNSFDTAIT